MFAQGDLYHSAGIFNSSDIKIKENIVDVDNAMSILNNLNCKRFTFKNTDYPHLNLPIGEHYGFIAQEVQPAFPGLVKNFVSVPKMDSTGTALTPSTDVLAVNYSELIPLLVQALKEQQSQIDSMIDAGNQRVTPQNQQNEKTGQSVELKDITSIILKQNDPNPFTESTRITFVIPEEVKVAKMIFTNQNGSMINTVDVQERGTGELQVFASDLSSGIYTYALVCDGKVIDSKKMMKK